MQKMTQFISWAVTGLFIIILIASCSGDKEGKLWEEVIATNNVVSYENYLTQFPDGKFKAAANDSIQDLIFIQTKTSNSIVSVYDTYHNKYPEGKYNDQFETLIYDEAIATNTQLAFEEYLTRFPNGKYISEFEHSMFDAIIKGQSTMTFEDYLVRFPDTDSIAVIEQALYDSVTILKTPESAEMYLKIFPEGKYLEEVNTELENVYHQRAIRFNREFAFTEFIQKFPESEFIKKLYVTTVPNQAEVIVADINGKMLNQFIAPDTLIVIEGTQLNFSYNLEGFHPGMADYTISINPFQIFNFNLKTTANYLIYDKFDKSYSPLTKTGNKYSFELQEGGKLYCKTTESQLQNVVDLDIDFKKDFVIAIKFRFVNELPRGKNYFGAVWGSENYGKYFFATIDGRLSFGEKENRYHSPDNVLGYSKWDANSGNEDTWSKANSYKPNDFNILTVEKTGNSVVYKLNGITFHKENTFRVPSGGNMGFGIGNTDVMVDYFYVQQ